MQTLKKMIPNLSSRSEIYLLLVKPSRRIYQPIKNIDARIFTYIVVVLFLQKAEKDVLTYFLVF